MDMISGKWKRNHSKSNKVSFLFCFFFGVNISAPLNTIALHILHVLRNILTSKLNVAKTMKNIFHIYIYNT